MHISRVNFLLYIFKILNSEEIKTSSRVFCLQKIVEVAELNIDRIKIIWTKIWNVIKQFFKKVGCDKNQQIAMFAIDLLK